MKPHRSWRDLGPSEPVGERASPNGGFDLPRGTEFPPELLQLLAEKERLESELKSLVGQGTPPPDAVRDALRFPVKVYTRESRIEERSLRKRDEQREALKRRLREKMKIRRSLLVSDLSARRKQRIRALQLRKSKVAEAEKRAEVARRLRVRARLEESFKSMLDQRVRRTAVDAAIRRRSENAALEARIEARKRLGVAGRRAAEEAELDRRRAAASEKQRECLLEEERQERRRESRALEKRLESRSRVPGRE